MTGFAQLRMTRETSWAEKLAHDLEYIADRSVRLYLRVCVGDRLADPRRSPRRASAAAASHVRHLRHAVRSTARAVDPGVAARDERDARPPRARQRGRVRRGAGRRSPRGGCRSSTSRAATSRSATRTAASRSSRTARSTTTASCASGSSARATGSGPQGDTEVLVHLYEERGPALRRASCAGCSRSRSGTGSSGGWCSRATASGSSRSTTASRTATLSFASELKALLRQPGLSREVDLDALEAYLAFNSIPAPLTIFREARKLPAGPPADRASGGEARLRRYARPRPVAAGRERAESRARSSPRSCASGCATRCARTWSPTCRSACCCPAASTRRRSPRSPRARAASRVSTFSIGFEERSFDELELARAGRRALRHRPPRAGRCGPTPSSCCRELAEAFDEPFADSSALPTYLVSQLAAEHVKVALSGEGGDELFGGYYTYVADLLAPRVGPLAARCCARWSSGCRARRPRSASTTRPSASRAPRTCRRSSATTAGRRSSRPRRAAALLDGRARRRSTRSTSTARATPRPRAPTSSPACRTSTSASTSSTTCW